MLNCNSNCVNYLLHLLLLQIPVPPEKLLLWIKGPLGMVQNAMQGGRLGRGNCLKAAQRAASMNTIAQPQT